MALTGLNVIVAMAEKNDCYIKNQKVNMGGIIVHSTAANNPYLKRYVDAVSEVGVNPNNNTWNMSSAAMGRKVCVHDFLGYDIRGILRVAQILPYDTACWGNGSETTGSCNYNPDARIQFEIQEDSTNDKGFLEAQLALAAQHCAELCIMFNWNPLGQFNGAPVIMDHAESYAYRKGGNHSDVGHWIKKHGFSMDWFRNKVQDYMNALKGVTIGQTTIVRLGRGTGVPAAYANGGIVPGGTVIITPPPVVVTPPTVTGAYKIGDIVDFTGNVHYGNSNASIPAPYPVKAGKAKVTGTAMGGKHQYHLIGAQAGAGSANSNVYGWVDVSTMNGTSSNNATTSNLLPAKEIAQKVIAGSYGNNPGRANKLNSEGYNASHVQANVNAILNKQPLPYPDTASAPAPVAPPPAPAPAPAPAVKSAETIAKEIWAGKGGWGNNPERANKIKAAGQDPALVQKWINHLYYKGPKP